jgi:hypothetical protein
MLCQITGCSTTGCLAPASRRRVTGGAVVPRCGHRTAGCTTAILIIYVWFYPLFDVCFSIDMAFVATQVALLLALLLLLTPLNCHHLHRSSLQLKHLGARISVRVTAQRAPSPSLDAQPARPRRSRTQQPVHDAHASSQEDAVDGSRSATSGAAGGTNAMVAADGGNVYNSDGAATSGPVRRAPIRVALDSDAAAVCGAVLYQLDSFGTAEVWATSAPNHLTAIRGVAAAAAALAARAVPAGLSASATMSTSDQAFADDQKRGMRKLTLLISPAAPTPASVWEPLPLDMPRRPSTNRVTERQRVFAVLHDALVAPGGGGNVTPVQDATVVLEARGEQPVSRILKAALALQAAAGVPLQLQPWPGQVVDVAAEKRGEVRLAPGLLLQLSWSRTHVHSDGSGAAGLGAPTG